MSAAQRILIVEDEALIAMMLEDFLTVLGKQAAGVADSVADAMALIDEVEIDAAILDVNLRGGEKSWLIADALAARNIPFLFASGGSDEQIDVRYRTRPTLTKPFSMDTIARALDSLAAGQVEAPLD